MIEERRGNIFLSTAKTITVTVNCEGVMGAGIALEARLRWPDLFDAYRNACESGDLRIGRVWLWKGPSFPRPGMPPGDQHVLCFPSKDRWRAPSKLDFIDEGLADLVARRQELALHHLAMPHLGASHGKLRWSNVLPLIRRHLDDAPDLRVELWEHAAVEADPWLEGLKAYLGPEPFDEQRVKERLDLSTVTQARRVIEALRSPMVTTMAGLPAFLGETTLVAIYEHLRQPKPDQGSMF